MKRLCAVALTLALGGTTLFASQEKTIELSLAQIQANRKVIIKEIVQPAPNQEEAFWQTYWEYRGHIGVLNDKVIALIDRYEESYAAVDDATATEMVEEILSIHARRAELKRQYVKKFEKILIPKQVVRWYQIENKLDAIAMADVAVSIPIDR